MRKPVQTDVSHPRFNRRAGPDCTGVVKWAEIFVRAQEYVCRRKFLTFLTLASCGPSVFKDVSRKLG